MFHPEIDDLLLSFQEQQELELIAEQQPQQTQSNKKQKQKRGVKGGQEKGDDNDDDNEINTTNTNTVRGGRKKKNVGGGVDISPKQNNTHNNTHNGSNNAHNNNAGGAGKNKGNRKTKKEIEKEMTNDFHKAYIPSSSQQPVCYSHLPSYIVPMEKQMLENKLTKPKNTHQEEYANLLRNRQKKIVIAVGPAGTGKTLFATEQGIRHFYEGEQIEKLIFTRPSVSVDENLGYLPGTLEDKMAPWVRPIYDVLYQFFKPKEIEQMMEDKLIEISPLGFMRGRTFKNCWIVADEMQNSTISQMKMLLTRLGENSRLIITGDLEQYDLAIINNGLMDFLDKMKRKRSNSIRSFFFDRQDIQREDVVREVLDIYSAEEISGCEDDDTTTPPATPPTTPVVEKDRTDVVDLITDFPLLK